MTKSNLFNKQEGWIELICGPMFSGKSEELLRKLNLLQYAKMSYVLFKPKMDNRFGHKQVLSRDGRKKEAIDIEDSQQIIEYINKQKRKINVVAIDEAQFFDEKIVEVCEWLANHKYIVYAAGLDCDYTATPFANVAKLLAISEEVTKLSAICTVCGAPASRTQKLKIDNSDNVIELGDSDKYTARCRHHHTC